MNSIDETGSGVIYIKELENWCNRYLPFAVTKEDIRILFNDIDADKGGCIDTEEFKRYMESDKDAGCLSKLCSMLSDWKTPIAFTTFILMGVFWFMVHEGFSFITALYCAITLCSTGGLQATARTDVSVAFAGFFMMIGIPLYGLSLNSGASFVMGRIIAMNCEAELQKSREEATMEVCKLLKEMLRDGTVEMIEFIQFQLLRAKGIQYVWIERQKDLFRGIDVDGGGQLDMAELVEWDPTIQVYINKLDEIESSSEHELVEPVQRVFDSLDVI